MDSTGLAWIIAALLAWWVGIVAASTRREVMMLEDESGEEPMYSVVSLFRRLLDDPVGLGLRLRFSRWLAVGMVPLGLAMAARSGGFNAVVPAVLLGWFAAALIEPLGAGRWGRRLARFPRGRGFAVWVRLTLPAARGSRPLLRLRGSSESLEPESGLVFAEGKAALTPVGARLTREERRLLRRLLASTAILVSDIMTRWPQVQTLTAETPLEAAAAVFRAAGRSRLPVLDGADVVGLINFKNVLARRPGAKRVGDVMRPAYFVYEGATVQGLLEELQEAHEHLAIVVDRLGRTVGVATMEDVLEEIVGELYDEREAPEGRA